MIQIIYSGTSTLEDLKDKEYQSQFMDEVIDNILYAFDNSIFIFSEPFIAESPHLINDRVRFNLIINLSPKQENPIPNESKAD